MNKLIYAFLTCLCLVNPALAQQTTHTETLNWSWPTVRADGTTLALSSIGSIVIYDTTQLGSANTPGAVVPCNAGTFPPTTATGTCTTSTLTAGNHSFVAVVFDNSSTPDTGTVSMAVSVTVPLSGPGPVTNFTGKLN